MIDKMGFKPRPTSAGILTVFCSLLLFLVWTQNEGPRLPGLGARVGAGWRWKNEEDLAKEVFPLEDSVKYVEQWPHGIRSALDNRGGQE